MTVMSSVYVILIHYSKNQYTNIITINWLFLFVDYKIKAYFFNLRDPKV